MTLDLVITPDAADAIRRFTGAYEASEGTARDREETRSYSYEALVRILRANPDAFDFVARMEAVEARKKGR